MATIGVVLAGGKSRRFGKPKALARIEGETLIERSIRVLAGAVDEVRVSVSDYTPSDAIAIARSLGAKIVRDAPDVNIGGALAGLISSCEAANGDICVILAVDYPFITRQNIYNLIKIFNQYKYDAITPMLHEGYPLQTFGIVKNYVIQKIKNLYNISKYKKIRFSDLYRGSRTVVVPWMVVSTTPINLLNANTPRVLENPGDFLHNIYNGPDIKNNNIYILYWEAIDSIKKLNFNRSRNLFYKEALFYRKLNLKLFSIHAERDAEGLPSAQE